MYHQALIDVAAGGQASGAPDLSTLVAGALRALDAEPRAADRHRAQPCGIRVSPGDVTELLPEGPLPVGAPAKGGLAGWQLRRVAEHVDTCLHGPIFTSTLAGVAQLSTGHFCRAFKASTGETPHAYVVRQRIRRAQVLMRETRDTLSQIACACGLSDQAHLTRLFRRLLGTTPNAWRRRAQQVG